MPDDVVMEPYMDFATIRDESDMRYARLAVAGKHPQFSGTYRVVRAGKPVLSPQSCAE